MAENTLARVQVEVGANLGKLQQGYKTALSQTRQMVSRVGASIRRGFGGISRPCVVVEGVISTRIDNFLVDLPVFLHRGLHLGDALVDALIVPGVDREYGRHY